MRRTPVLTLVYGLVLAVGLLVMSSVAASKRVPAAAEAPPTSPSPSAAAAPSPPPLAKTNAVWAGEVDGGKATIAISVQEGVAVAYLCDGNRTEIWLQGIAEDGQFALSSKKGAALRGTYNGRTASGKVTVGGREWTFTISAAAPPSGLYRSTSLVRNAQVVCGWIVLATGRQVGICSTNEEQPAPAPRLDTNLVRPIDPKALT